MDLLDRINALTDDQLQMVAERDDASGVLAAYRLAELRGLPAPEREVVVMGDGYVIVAAGGVIRRVAASGVNKIIREQDGEYCVYSEDGGQAFGCYPSMEQAQERLAQIHVFGEETAKEIIREGTFVSWNSSGGRARGRVEYVMREGTLGIPDSDFSINAEPDDPAVLIRIWRQTSEGWGETETLVGHKMSTLTAIESLAKESYVPPQGAQEAGKRALQWISEGHAGANFTDVGRARAAQLARGDAVSEETIRRMASFLARHGANEGKPGWDAGDDGFPSPARVAWDAWGGDAGRTWANMMVARFEREETNKNGDSGGYLSPVQRLLYESLEVVAETFGKFGPGVDAHGSHYMTENPFASQGMKCSNCVFFKGGGGCEILNIRVAPEAVCKFWIIPEDLITEPTEARSLPNMGKASFVKAEHEDRFTLGPLYVPDFMDAHGEWTDAEELQQAVWGWVKSGDRRIFLQHDRDVEAGEWVEVMTMPQPWTVDMKSPTGEVLGQVTYPPNTVFLGVQWNEKAWSLVKRGMLRGYSIGGFSDRMLADLPENGERDGVEMS
jgi:hypothetical protein